MSRIVLHIDRLVLHDLDNIDAETLSRSLKKAVQRQLGDPESRHILAGQANRDYVKAAPLTVSQQKVSNRLGRSIGERVVGACTGKERS